MTIHTINNVKQHHIVPDSFEAMILKLFMVLPKIDPVFENWLFYSTRYISFIPSLFLYYYYHAIYQTIPVFDFLSYLSCDLFYNEFILNTTSFFPYVL